jgi:hypothetical protein
MTPSQRVPQVVERLLRLPPAAARAELGKILAGAKPLPAESKALEAALDYNARLVTAIRETCTARGTRCPWLG